MGIDSRSEVEAAVSEGMLKIGSADYKGAEITLRRALDLDPEFADAHRRLGQALACQAALIRDDARAKNDLLDQATQSIVRAEQILGDQTAATLHDLAWISDERGTRAD